ncbi:methyl-accepting chemotaxis protein [Gammaproteobacteria bacterium]
MNNSIKAKLLLGFGIVGVVFSIAFSGYIYITDMNSSRAEAKLDAIDSVTRTAQIFMISTQRFHDQFIAAKTPEEKETIRKDWIRTVTSIDDAIIHDFGPDKVRVRLIGDTGIFHQPQQGGEKTRIEIPFEREAAEMFMQDASLQMFDRIEDGILRLSIPLPSNIHPGCAECHQISASEERVLLGTLNAYSPLSRFIDEARMDAASTALILIGIFTLSISVIYFIIFNIVIKPLDKVKTVTHKLEQELRKGEIADLTRRIVVKNHDEVGQVAYSFNNLLSALSNIISEIDTATNQLASTSEEMSATTIHSADRAQVQQAEIAKINDTMKRIADVVLTVADNASQAAEAAQTSSKEAYHGLQIINYTQNTITELATELNGAAKLIGKLNENSQSIGKVVDVINDIANQTNLLALNAAIEAARAGEQGRGFAVVASEVRSLANRTQTSTKEIQSMIDQLQSNMQRAVQTMIDSQHKVENNVTHAAEAEDALKRIHESISRISSMNQNIASATVEQKSAIEHIRDGVGNIHAISSEITDSSREIASASEALAKLALQLSSVVERFNTVA